MKQNFIKTKDVETKNLLIKEGFKLISENQGVYTFLNDTLKRFSDDNHKITYTNILHV